MFMIVFYEHTLSSHLIYCKIMNISTKSSEKLPIT